MTKIFLPIYTKSFGGKIWRNLHSVSPGNNFCKKKLRGTPWNFSITKKFQTMPLQILTRQKIIHHFVRKLTVKNLKLNVFCCQFLVLNLRKILTKFVWSKVSFAKWCTLKERHGKPLNSLAAGKNWIIANILITKPIDKRYVFVSQT